MVRSSESWSGICPQSEKFLNESAQPRFWLISGPFCPQVGLRVRDTGWVWSYARAFPIESASEPVKSCNSEQPDP